MIAGGGLVHDGVRAVNIGLAGFADPIRAAGAPVVALDWRPPAAGDRELGLLLAWLEDQSIHPNVYGHREFAKLIFRTLEIYDAKSPTCKLEVP